MERLNPSDIISLKYLCPDSVEQNVSLAKISQWGIGGLADVLIRPSNTSELAKLRAWFDDHCIKHIVIGATSNLLFSDKGLRIPCIQIGSRMAGIQFHNTNVFLKSGTWVPALARYLQSSSLTGGEHICGIPGTLGGLICMNGGSQRKGIGENVKYVKSVDTKGNVIIRNASECEFAYRQSVYQQADEVISEATLFFMPGDRSKIRREMLQILAERNRKFPRKQPNCGSVFKSNPSMYAEVGPPGAVIERLGFKGRKCGGAQVSPWHANFIVNNGGATARNVLDLILDITKSVKESTGYYMEAEVKCLDEEGDSVLIFNEIG